MTMDEFKKLSEATHAIAYVCNVQPKQVVDALSGSIISEEYSKALRLIVTNDYDRQHQVYD